MIGRKLKNRYEILETLAQGASTTTYRARDTLLNRDVLVKVLPQLSDDARQRFFEQAKAATRLNHPNIAAVYDFDADEDGSPFVVSEYVEGKPLSDYIPSPPEIVVRLGEQIADALAYAHRFGIIHAELNPSDIRVTPSGQAKIVDLGLKFIETSATVTRSGSVIGNPAYLSPEQAQGLPTDARSDIYALGVVLYELSTGKPPFTGDSPMAVLMQQVNQPPPPPRSIAPNVPPALEQVILTALEKDPARRFQSSQMLADALERVEESKPEEAAAHGRAASPTSPASQARISPTRQNCVTTSVSSRRIVWWAARAFSAPAG